MSRTRATRWAGVLISTILLLLVFAQPSRIAKTAPAPPEPQPVSFSVTASDPLVSSSVHPADILGAGGVPLIPCAGLGLVCTDLNTGANDQIGGLSFGQDFNATGLLPIQFSVAPGSRGAAGTAVRVEADCSPPEPQADVFGTTLDGTNVQIFDGNGIACGSNSGLPLYLDEGASGSSVHALVGDPCLYVDVNCDGVPENPVYFTLLPGSPTLALIGATPADILMTQGGFMPVKWADGVADLGLASGDVIDAFCLKENSNGVFDGEDLILFSLAPGSPTLSSLSASAADILLPGRPPRVFYRAALLGLQATDNVNGLMCSLESLSQLYLPLISR